MYPNYTIMLMYLNYTIMLMHPNYTTMLMYPNCMHNNINGMLLKYRVITEIRSASVSV